MHSISYERTAQNNNVSRFSLDCVRAKPPFARLIMYGGGVTLHGTLSCVMYDKTRISR